MKDIIKIPAGFGILLPGSQIKNGDKCWIESEKKWDITSNPGINSSGRLIYIRKLRRTKKTP